MITIDDKVQFDPFKEITGFASEDNRGKLVTGTVVLVNYEHKWFSVEYSNRAEYGDHKLKTPFKFCDIGEAVKICG